CSRASPAVRRCGRHRSSPTGPSRPARGSWWSCPTPASATSPRRSSPHRERTVAPAVAAPSDARQGGRYAVAMLGIDTFARVAKELRRDVLAARDRDPAAKGVGPAEILATWPGIHALLSYRMAHALDDAGVPIVPR